jgi:hypothetical protein
VSDVSASFSTGPESGHSLGDCGTFLHAVDLGHLRCCLRVGPAETGGATKTGAGDAELDRALLDYVKTRKVMLQVVHRFFDEAGLRLMRQAYDSPEDGAILDALRRRLQGSTSALPTAALQGRWSSWSLLPKILFRAYPGAGGSVSMAMHGDFGQA